MGPPPLDLPTFLQFTGVESGSSVALEGGNRFHFLGDVVARIDGDSSGVFTINGLETFRLEHDPELPPGAREWVSVDTVDGPGPIDTRGAQALGIMVGLSTPLQTQQTQFTATAVVVAAGTVSPILMAIPIQATLDPGEISIFSIPNDALLNGFAAGETAPLQFQFRSTFTQGVTGNFSCATPQLDFSSPAPFRFAVAPRVDARPVLTPVTLPVRCAIEAPPGHYDLAFTFVPEDGRANVSIELSLVVNAAQPPIPIDPNVVWEETTDLSISIDTNANAWYCGHVNDILLRSDATFVAAQTGGIWAFSVTDPDAAAGCTTDDLDNPNFTCMAFGPDSPLQIFAACSNMTPGTNPGTGLFSGGFGAWGPVFIVDQFNTPLLTDDILRILVLPAHRALLLATQKGVFISMLPPAGRPTFALMPGLPDGTYSGICLGPNESVAVSLWGAPGGIFLGTWSGNQLVFAPAQMIADPSRPNGDIDLTQVGRTSLASCGSDPSKMYAVFSGLNGRIYRILRSDSGGASWSPVFNLGDRVAQQFIGPLAPDSGQPDMAGHQGEYNNCIAVGFHDSNEVGIGWENGPWLTSNASDVLSQWTLAYEDANSPHMHGDIHAVLFDPGDTSGNTIYVGSDGGLTFTNDRAGPIGYQSRLSKHIRNLQFYPGVPPGEKGAAGIRGGGISASPTVPGLIAGPTQDNGNLFCALEGSRAWQVLDGGDGIVTRFLSNGLLLSVSPDSTANPGRPGRLSFWNGSAFDQTTDIPNPGAGATALSIFGDVQPVTNPSFALPNSQNLLFAVAATQDSSGQLKEVYGLFTDGSIGKAIWQPIATLPLQPGDAISSLASLNGHQVFAGTEQGRIFSFAPFQIPFELVVSPADKGRVHDITIVRDDDTLAFALYDGPTTKAILQSNFFNWDPLGSNGNVARGLNLDGFDNFIAMTFDPVASALYACTDNRVFVSRDEGDTWLLATKHLPSRVHCTSFALGAPRPSGRYLYLSTYGRSVWQAKL